MLNFVHFIPGEEVLGFHQICKGVHDPQSVKSHFPEMSNSLLPSDPHSPFTVSIQPPSHITCIPATPSHMSCWLWVWSVLHVAARGLFLKCKTYPFCCPAYRTAMVFKGYQDKNLNWIYHTRSSIICLPSLSLRLQNSLTVLLLFPARLCTKASAWGI